MGKRKFLVNIDLGNNEIQNVVIEKLAAAPATPPEGRIYYDTAKKQIGYYNGTAWVYFSAKNIVAVNKDKDGVVISANQPFISEETADTITLTFDQSKLALNKSQVGLPNVDNVQQIPMSYLDASALLGGASPSDVKVPTQKAVKTYVDNQIASIASGTSYKGNWDGTKTIAANLTALGLSKIEPGYQFRVTVAGTTSGVTTPSSGTVLQVGDLIIANKSKSTGYAAADFDGYDSTESPDLVRWNGAGATSNGSAIPLAKEYLAAITNAATGTVTATIHKCGVNTIAQVYLTNGTNKELIEVDILRNTSGDVTWSTNGALITGEIVIIGA